MEYISSDTNVWFDFYAISKLQLPFELDCTYIMYYETLRKEVIDPPELISDLREYGLVEIDLQTEEFYLAAEIKNRYKKLSGYDSIALAVAKVRGIMLLTGDNALRNAAAKENVQFMGSIGLIDRLLKEKRISQEDYIECLKAWKNDNIAGRRLPVDEIDKRISEYKDIRQGGMKKR